MHADKKGRSMENINEPNRWATPKNEEIVASPLDHLVGYMAIEFNNLEFILQLTLQKLTGTDHFGVTAIWSSLMWSGRIEMIDALMRARFNDTHQLRIFWAKKLKPFLGDVAADRNAIIHGMRSVETRKDGSTKHYITHNHFGDHGFARRRFRYDERELREIILDIRVAAEAMAKFDSSLIGGGPAPEELANLPVRRRPPRDRRTVA